MANPENCPHCGAQMKAWEQRMSPGLVKGLIRAIEVVHATGKNDFHFLEDLKMKYGPSNNFKKLRYWGLIWHTDETNLRNGRWLITTNGGKFLRGELKVPASVWTFRNKRLHNRDSKHLVGIEDFRGKVPEFQREFTYAIMPIQNAPATPPPGALL